jgi:thymidylate kinase
MEFSRTMDVDKANAQAVIPRPFLITFSGIDGAGKTTQIENLSSSLQQRGLRVMRLSFWEHVAVWSKMRSEVGQRAAYSRRGKRIADHSFTPKNGKHIRKWYLTAARSGFYMLDVARLQRLLAGVKECDVVIFDRYVYDQIANIYSPSFVARSYGQILLRQTPTPDLAFVLDVSPAIAFARKPEYPLEFMQQNRRNFLQLREFVPHLIVIPDATVERVKREIHVHISRSRLVAGLSPTEKTEGMVERAVVPPQSFCRVNNDPTATI